MASKGVIESFLSSFWPKIAFMVVTSAVAFVVSRFVQLDSDLKSLVVAISAGLIVFLLSYAAEHLQRWLAQRYVPQQSGIVAVFDNLAACKQELQSTFCRSHEVRLLLQIGRRELGDGDPSFFFSAAKKLGIQGPHIRMLRASTRSPFLSQKRAERRGARRQQWLTDMDILLRQINLLRDSFRVNIEDREHCEPYLWRIFLFDDTAYVSGYLYRSDNDEQAPVFKLVKGEKSLFSVFDRYFEYLWEKYNPTGNPDPEERWADWV